MVPTAKEINAAITGFPIDFANRALIAACNGRTAPSASAITINSSRDCMRRIENPPSNYLFIVCLASMLSVACGTAFNLALSISFPVTRQIP